MTDEKDFEEALEEAGYNTKEETSWTSFDLYYKGFHVKKSLAENTPLDKVKKAIEGAIELGFEPSWNKETSTKALDEDPGWVKDDSEDNRSCPTHGTAMTKSKKGNWYHREEGSKRFCMGQGYIEPKE